MKLHLPRLLQCVVLGNAVVSLPVAAETLDNTSLPTELAHNLAGQFAGFEALTSEALLLVVFILLVFAVIAHKPKAP